MAQILTVVTKVILNKLVDFVSHEIGLAWGAKDEFIKLQDTLEMILSVIADAEKKQVKDAAVRLWLARLRDVAYDADDVMDDFCYETMRRSNRGNNLTSKVFDFASSSNPLAFRFKKAKKIKKINQRLDVIAKDMGRFQFLIASSDAPTLRNEHKERQTTSLLNNESEIVGRDGDKNELIKLLTTVTPVSSTSSDYRNLEKVSIVSLVGMGGLGKTTLAQLVYKDDLVKTHFDPMMWVCVSDQFDVENILIKVLESITEAEISITNFDVLVKKVHDKLNRRRFLLVLDDLWNEDQEQWERLLSPLLAGAQGSRILITTRKDQVASVVGGSIPPFVLKQLPEDACWSIMEQKVFSNNRAQITPKMINIGYQIVRRCGGLPLAAKFLGSLMRSKSKESDWISIRDDDIWNTPESHSRILPVLKLSYGNLPSHLKQCFSFCSIFPNYWVISKKSITELWIAEGFVKPSDMHNKRLMEDSADEYFESLVQSSFFHCVNKSSLGDIEMFTMHDLVHDLAQDVAGDHELSSLKLSELKNVSKLRRLQLTLDEQLSAASLNSLSSAKKLRTIIVPARKFGLHPNVFSSNKQLRVLHVGNPTGYSKHSKLSDLNVKCRHLRYLYLSFYNLSQSVNHQSISKLYNLKSLVFFNMRGIQNLLENIQPLQKLRLLDLSFSDIEKLPDSVTSLCNLRALHLSNCKNLKAFPNSVSGLKYLRILDLSRTPIERLPDFVSNLHNLNTLVLNSCSKLRSLPDYVTRLDKLSIFDIERCSLLEALPTDFGALSQLRSLNLAGTKIKILPNSCANLTNLELLHLFWCELPKDVKNWTKLRKFTYFGEGMPTGIGELVNLRHLTYNVREEVIGKPECNSCIDELGNLNFLEMLFIYDLQNVKERVDAERANLKEKRGLHKLQLCWHLPKGSKMWLDNEFCSHSTMILEALQPHTGLKWLNIFNFVGCELPMWMCIPSCLPNLERLELSNCHGMKELPAAIGELPRLTHLRLENMRLRSSDVYFPLLTRLDLTDMFLLEKLHYSYPSLKELVLWGTNFKFLRSVERSQISSLTTLRLDNVVELVVFPKRILQNNCSLRYLIFRNCNQLQGFCATDDDNYREVALFDPEFLGSSLQELDFANCPVLRYLPDLRGWTSLRLLSIFNCSQLKESITYDLKSLSFLEILNVDYIQREGQLGDPCDEYDMINLMDNM